jgi:hypothetical protein
VNRLRNQSPLIQPPEQVLREADCVAMEGINSKVAIVLPLYINRFFKEGERTLKENRLDDAVEAFICHWTFFRGKPDPPQAVTLVETVKNQTGFDLASQGICGACAGGSGHFQYYQR